MTKEKIAETIIAVVKDYCDNYHISGEINLHTTLIGENKLFDSMGLVNVIVDIETAFMEQDIDISLTSEKAMSGRISPFRSIDSICNFIAKQLEAENK